MAVKFNPDRPERDRRYDYCGINFFLGDKDDLMQVLNDNQVPYSSFSHFVRASINVNLKQLGIDFRLTER